MSRTRTVILATVFSGFAIASSALNADADAVVAASAPSESQILGRDLLMNMAEFLAGLDGFTVTMRGGYDVLQPSGEKIQFLERRKLVLRRPDRLRVEDATSGNDFILFDGERITAYDASHRVYAQAPQPGTIDDAIVYFTRELGMRMPLAVLASTRLPLELDRRVIAVDYVETSRVFGDPVHHVVARTDLVDFQVWISAGKEPWPRRIVLGYHQEAGHPQYWAEFDEWSSSQRFRPAQFHFQPSLDDQQIVFAAQLESFSEEARVDDAAATKGERP